MSVTCTLKGVEIKYNVNDLFDKEIDELNTEPSQALLSSNRFISRGHVKNWAKYAAISSIVPVPFIDTCTIAFCQVKMIQKICDVYNIQFERQVVSAIITGLASGGLTTFFVTTAGKNLLKAVPVVGLAVSIFGMSVVAYVTTIALGHAFIEHFESTDSLETSDKNLIITYFTKHLDALKNG